MSAENTFRDALKTTNIPTSDWFQGRGVYGGLVFARMISALRDYTQSPIRRLNVDMCAPVLDMPTLTEVRLMRRGVNTQFFSIVCLQDDKVVAFGSAVCGGPRYNGADIHNSSPPEKGVPQHSAMPHHPLMPAFTQHFDYWPTMGDLPFTQSNNLRCGGWIASKVDAQLDAEKVVALIDAWWPAISLKLDKPRPMGTISFSVDLCIDDIQEHHEPCLLECICEEVTSGFAIEHNRLWSKDGTLLAIAQQNVVIIQ